MAILIAAGERKELVYFSRKRRRLLPIPAYYLPNGHGPTSGSINYGFINETEIEQTCRGHQSKV